MITIKEEGLGKIIYKNWIPIIEIFTGWKRVSYTNLAVFDAHGGEPIHPAKIVCVPSGLNLHFFVNAGQILRIGFRAYEWYRLISCNYERKSTYEHRSIDLVKSYGPGRWIPNYGFLPTVEAPLLLKEEGLFDFCRPLVQRANFMTGYLQGGQQPVHMIDIFEAKKAGCFPYEHVIFFTCRSDRWSSHYGISF